MPTVSIIMNVRNGAATLREAVESAFNQTYRDWEMIVWDDCSTDDSAKMVAEFDDPRLRYFLAQHDTPLGQARELAMSQARGEWLAFLDQDDIWLPRKLELQMALTDSAQVGLVYGRTVCFYPGGRQRDYDQFHEFTELPEGDIFAELLGRGCFIAMSSSVLRRSIVGETGGIPGHIHIAPDYFLYLAACHRHSTRAVQQVVCRYRVHPGNMTSLYRRESLGETLGLVEEWGRQIPRDAFARRHAGISTALALEEMRHWKTMAQGVHRLMRTGSLGWIIRAPLVHFWRIAARRLRQPRWQKDGSAL
jgi:glycosyltransferase involved in cell wall biosynthesis